MIFLVSSVAAPTGIITATCMKTILVGFDGTEPAERALRRAADLAEAFRAHLVVASVATPPIPSPGLGAAMPGAPEQFAAGSSEVLEQADRHLEQARALLSGRAVDAEFVTEVGPAADRLVRLANERDADVIVVGTREPSFVERLLQGSVSEDVSRRAHRDVMIVH
jgi:nucleotide-binding universal stress UspA family protein